MIIGALFMIAGVLLIVGGTICAGVAVIRIALSVAGYNPNSYDVPQVLLLGFGLMVLGLAGIFAGPRIRRYTVPSH